MKRNAALALLGALPAAVPVVARAQASTVLRIGASPADTYAEPMYAADGGFFGRAGIEARFTFMNAASAIVQAVAGNALDLGIADPIQVAHAINAGVPLALFAGSGLYVTDAPTTMLVAKKGSALKAPKDFEGQTIGVISLASVSTLAVREWLRQGGADAEKVRFVEVPFSAMTPGLGRGTIAAAFLAEPFLTEGRDEITVVAKAYDAVAKSFYISSWFAPRDWLSKNAALARRLVDAIYESGRWANTHHAETVPILVKYTKVEPDRVRSMTRATFATSLDAAAIQPLLDVAYRYKQLEKPVSAAEIMARV